jgi:TldD protein
MEQLAQVALEEAQKLGIDYLDLRIGQLEREEIEVKNGIVDSLTHHQDQGFGVRVLANGGWGFVSRPFLTPEAMVDAVKEAYEIAKASSTVRREPLVLSEVEPVQTTYRTPVAKDPFQVPLEEKIALLIEAEKNLRSKPEVVVGLATMYISRERKWFFSSIGSKVEQEFIYVGAGIQATATDGKDVQTRSYPNLFGGNYAQKGYEFIEEMDLVGNAPRVAEEAVQLLAADPCPTVRTTLILHSSQLALQIHESCGHAVELDRVLGEEAGFVGKSFLTTDKLNNFQYGSKIVNLTADATTPGGLGTFAFDDEGVPAQRVPLVANGQFVGYLSGRDSAPRINQSSIGAMRCVGWQNVPIVRMTNINLEPGDMTLDELIASTEEGIYMEGIKSWSIDDRRYNFQFGCEIAWEIKNGKKVRMLKNPTYTGNTPEFWRNCDGIANDWQLWGFPNCGKGEPLQSLFVGHGTPSARFRNVQIGVK